MIDYRKIAKEIAADVAAGRLLPGDRLPPQRVFAYERGIAPSTAGRVYGELKRLGIVDGEVGRGTFIRAAVTRHEPALAEPRAARVDMESNYPILPDQHQLLAPALAKLASRINVLNAAMGVASVDGNDHARQAVAAALSSQGWTHSPSSLLFAGNGRQAIAAAFSALAPLGGRVGFEELTYPVAKAIATRLGMEAIPIPCDDDGLRPDGLEQAHRDSRLHAVYLQPTLQNPLGMTMSAQRRSELATVLTRLNGPVVVEDRVYAFLEEAAPPPLAAFAHDHVVVVDSLSKIVAPGLTLGFVCAPEHLITPLANALIVGAWAPQRFSFEIGVRWLCDGSAEALKAAKRLDALKRQSIARTALKGLDIRANPTAYHLLLALPPHWRAEAYALAAERRGIAITPGAAFAVASGFAPNLVRLALAPPALDDLSVALGTLSALARSKTESDFVRWSG